MVYTSGPRDGSIKPNDDIKSGVFPVGNVICSLVINRSAVPVQCGDLPVCWPSPLSTCLLTVSSIYLSVDRILYLPLCWPSHLSTCLLTVSSTYLSVDRLLYLPVCWPSPLSTCLLTVSALSASSLCCCIFVSAVISFTFISSSSYSNIKVNIYL